MIESDTATPDTTREQWDAIGASGEDQEDLDDSAGGDAPTDDLEGASPAAADADAGAEPDGSAVEGEEGAQPEGDASLAGQAPSQTGQPAPESPEVQPLVLRADGREIAIPGAVITDGYAAIPVAGLKVLQSHLADRGQWIERERGYKAEIAELRTGQTENDAKAQVIIEHFAGLLENREAAVAWFENFDANKAVLQKDMELAALKSKVEHREKRDTEATREQSAREFQEWKPNVLQDTLSTALARPEFKDAGLDPKLLMRKLSALGNGAFFQAAEDIQELGVKAGQIAPNYGLIMEMIRTDAEMVRAARAAKAEATQAKKRNAAATGKTPSKAPLAVSAKGSPAPGGKVAKALTSKEEWEDSLNN